jgi:hypothetical protein
MLTSIALVIISSLLLKNLIHKKFENVFYLTVLFMFSILFLGLPISKAFNKNEDYQSIYSLHQIEENNNINTYSLGDITPELLWDYNGIIPNIFNNEVLTIPNENTFGLLISPNNFEYLSKFSSKDFNLTLIETYNLNIGSKNKDRLIGKFYLVSKK